eukprot:scaffold2798_cov160-Ochromonas_danica.AAC.8
MDVIDSDILGIASLMRRHIEIRNRSWMKRIHRDCFVGSEAVDFLVAQGFADTRKAAVELGVKMSSRKLIRNISDSRKFSDSLHYYRFAEDDQVVSVLDQSNAGNGSGVSLGHGGCKWSFAPHTAHNSYILDIGLAEELERAVAGASVESRAIAINKLRSRVNGTMISVYQRKRPRGDWKNVKMTGIVAENPKGFVRSILNFDKRRQWESTFEDGVVVEGIDIGEAPNALLRDDDDEKVTEKISSKTAAQLNHTPLSLPDNVKPQTGNIARVTDDVYAFLQTLDMADIPNNMAIAFLNDPERQHALAYLRKQMMLSNPQECMLCQATFESTTDIRFCPCCAMVCCAGCVSKRVFEVVSRNVMSVCVHCYRESSRIFQPPEAVQDTKNIDESLRGKWWRPEELGIVDYSTNPNSLKLPTGSIRDSVAAPSLYNDQDVLVITNITALRPLIPGLLDDLDLNGAGEGSAGLDATQDSNGEDRYPSPVPPPPPLPSKQDSVSSNNKTARCKMCGLMISRDMEAIEAHMEECTRVHSSQATGKSSRRSTASISDNSGTYVLDANNNVTVLNSNHKQFAGISRKRDIESRFNTRIIYRTARAPNDNSFAPREVCALQDCFVDSDGTSYLYEVSVRHSEVTGMSGYVTADVMLVLYIARPIKGNKSASSITIIQQIDTHIKEGAAWTFLYNGSLNKYDILALRKQDLVRELKQCADLPNLLNNTDCSEDSRVCLDDFELLAVLGRGGFGKVMQVRHKPTNQIYAMKILKKSELRRRRQVERTQTERTILANVRHPFVVCLHYAFQNAQKLYMVMDFVQGGDFFTLMKNCRRIPEDWARLYVMQIALALQHLHDREIVYRDLKPENILLCADGYLKLTDFGLSRYFETRPPNPEDIVDGDKDDFVTRSFCGTEQYMSPEMLLQQGHNYRMDWWCLGLLMHEMISGRHPFHGSKHYDTLRNMVTKPPTIDERLSPRAAAVVKGFLNKNPPARLGGKEGIAELYRLSFFSVVNWEDLLNKRIDMPYKPKLQGETDISSFESVFTNEKPIDSVPEPDVQQSNTKKGAKMFGMFGKKDSAPNCVADSRNDADAFKGFSFNKEDAGLLNATNS